MKNRIFPILKLIIVACIIYYLISHDRMDMGMLFRLWTSPLTVVMALILIFWVLPMGALRIWLILDAYDFRMPFMRLFLINWIGGFFNVSLPWGVTGDVVKGAYIAQAARKKDMTPIIVTLVIDRIIGISSLIILSFFFLLYQGNPFAGVALQRALVYMVAGLFAGMLIFYGFLLVPFKPGKDPLAWFLSILPGKNRLLNIYDTFRHFQHRKRVLLYTMLISISIHFSMVLMMVKITDFMEMSVAFSDQLFIISIGFMTTVIPFAPGGIGIGHVAFDNLYRMIGVSGGADIFNLFVTVYLSVLLTGGIPYLFMGKQPEKEVKGSSV